LKGNGRDRVKSDGKTPNTEKLLLHFRRNGKKGHPGKAPKPCYFSTGENAEKVNPEGIKQIDRFSNSIRDSDRSEDSKAITLKWKVDLEVLAEHFLNFNRRSFYAI
jgi:hypothetical protein